MGQPSPSPFVRSELSGFNVPFDRDKFTQLIKRHGYNITWEKAALCPFLKGPNPKDHDINCSVCHGGFIFYDPQTTKMLVQALNISQHYYAYGRFASGKALITAFPEFKLSFWDRITLTDSRIRNQELIKRQRTSLTDQFKYGALAVSYLSWVDASSTQQQATQGIDFNVNDDGTITWVTTNRPGADTFYSVVYDFRPSYLVLDVPHTVRDVEVPNPADDTDTQYEFPVQVVAQLDQFVRNQGKDPSDESDTANPFPVQGSAFTPSA